MYRERVQLIECRIVPPREMIPRKTCEGRSEYYVESPGALKRAIVRVVDCEGLIGWSTLAKKPFVFSGFPGLLETPLNGFSRLGPDFRHRYSQWDFRRPRFHHAAFFCKLQSGFLHVAASRSFPPYSWLTRSKLYHIPTRKAKISNPESDQLCLTGNCSNAF